MKYLILVTILIFLGCKNNTRVLSHLKSHTVAEKNQLGDYWYQGKAEITTYRLQQNRYENIHPGEVIMIFVTEDFLTDFQVKNDHYENPNSTPILKNNKISRFTTGLYDYSMMTSTFTPTNRNKYPHTLKVTMSSQDWCGQSYHQLNYREGNYQSTSHSYFEDEADKIHSINKSLLEDEIVNLFRFGPEKLPVGELDMIPTLSYLHFKHLEGKTYKTQNSLSEYRGAEWVDNDVWQYVIQYPNLQRTVTYYINKDQPYKILGWDDAYPSSFDGKIRTTRARKHREDMVAYWTNNTAKDSKHRKNLGLSIFENE